MPSSGSPRRPAAVFRGRAGTGCSPKQLLLGANNALLEVDCSPAQGGACGAAHRAHAGLCLGRPARRGAAATGGKAPDRPFSPPGTRIRWPPITVHASMGRVPNDHNPPGGISTRLVSFSADSADPPGVNDYDGFAEAYAASNENNLVNAYYERPAMLALAGDVAGRRILDAGCGAGPLFAALRDRGAIVTGFDKSAGMLELARRRLGDEADLQVADLASPLPIPDDTFDDVTASLVLHYLQDWAPALN